MCFSSFSVSYLQMPPCFHKKSKQQAVSSSSTSSVLESLPHLPREVIAYSFSFLSLRHLAIVSSINREWRKAAMLAWSNKRELNLNTKIWESGIVDSVIMKDRCSSLRALRIQRLRHRCFDTEMVAKLVQCLCYHLPRLESLNLEQADLGPLILPLCPAFLSSCLRSLHLSGQYFNAGNMNSFSSSLSSMQSLTYLNLSGCNINEQCIDGFVSALFHLTSLEHLALHHNHFSQAPPPFFTALSHLSRLQHLDLGATSLDSHANELVTVLSSLTVLRYLNLGNNKLTRDPVSFAALCTSIAHLSLLQSLILDHTELNPDAITPLVLIFPSLQHLQNLDLSWNQGLNIDAFSTFASSLHFLVSLTSLNISGCSLGVQGFVQLSSALSQQNHLQTLEIYTNGINFREANSTMILPSSITSLDVYVTPLILEGCLLFVTFCALLHI